MKLLNQYKGLRREIYVLFFGRIVTSLGSMIWPMLTLIMNKKMGMNAETIAIFMIAAGVVMLPLGMVGGRLADRFDKKKIIVFFDTVSVVFYIICGFIPLSYVTLLMIVLASACQSMEGPSYDALIADLTKTEDRERAYSLQYLGNNLGLVLSPTISGFLFKNALWLAFIISGVAIGVSTLLIFFRIKDTTPVSDTSEASLYQTSRKGESLLKILRENRVILIFTVVMGLQYSAYNQFNYLMPLDMGRVHGEDGALIFGTVMSLNCIVVILFTPFITSLFKRMPESVKTLCGVSLQMAGFVFFASVLGYIPWYYPAMLIFTWGEIFSTISHGPYLSSRVPSSHRGRINSVSTVIASFFTGASNLIIGKLFDNLGSSAAWTFTYAIGSAGILLCVILIIFDKKRYPKLYERFKKTPEGADK